MSLQRKTDLALRALDALRRRDGHDGHLAGALIAERIGTTTQFLPQVMGPLVRGGWVESGRGPGGGYRLAMSLNQISVLDVIEAVEGPTEDGRCVLRDARCPSDERCALHDVWTAARQRLVLGLDQLTVLDAFPGGTTP